MLLSHQCCWFLTPPVGLKLLAKISLRASGARMVKGSSCPVTALQTLPAQNSSGEVGTWTRLLTQFPPWEDTNQKWKKPQFQQEFWALKDYHHPHSFLGLMPSSIRRPKAWAVSKKVGGHSSHCIQPLRGLCPPGRLGEITPWELNYCMSGLGHGNLPSRESTEISRPRHLTKHHTDSISQLRI